MDSSRPPIDWARVPLASLERARVDLEFNFRLVNSLAIWKEVWEQHGCEITTRADLETMEVVYEAWPQRAS